MRMTLRALLFLLPLSALASSAGDKRFLWKVTSAEGRHAWLLGSIHAAKKELYPLAPEIEKAFEASKILVVEADQTKVEPLKLQQLIVARAVYPAGQSLSTQLPPERAKKALELAAKVGLPAAQAERMKPWFIALNASIIKIQSLGYDPKLGIDQHFMNAARARNKPIAELESAEFQLDLLSGFNDELQHLFVESTLEDFDKVEGTMKEIFDAWTRGDVAGLEKVVLKDGMSRRPEMAPLRLKLFDERNVGMAAKVEGYLKSGDVHFVIMGAGHLLGEKGVVALLQAKGLKVEQVESK